MSNATWKHDNHLTDDAVELRNRHQNRLTRYWKQTTCRYRTDENFRLKVRRSCCVTSVIFMIGWLKGIIGPSFPDILHLTKTKLEAGSAYLTALYTGKILRNLLGGLIYDKVNKDLYIIVLSSLNALIIAVLPWCTVYWPMVMIYGLHGLMISCLELGIMTESVNLWDGQARQIYLQITTFVFSVSSILSPLAIMPFLNKPSTKSYDSNLLSNISEYSRQTETNIFTENFNTGKSTTINNSLAMAVYNASVEAHDFPMQSSSLFIGFTITSLFVLSCTIPFVFFLCSSKLLKRHSDEHLNEPRDELQHDKDVNIEFEIRQNDNDVTENFISNTREDVHHVSVLSYSDPIRFLIFVNSCVFGALHSAMEIGMSDMMPTFCRTYLAWSPSQAAIEVSVLFLFFTIGRLLCSLLLKIISLTKLIGFFVSSCVVGYIILCFSAHAYSTPGTWVSIAFAGLGISALYPSQLGWTSHFVTRLNGKLTAILLCTMYIGSMSCPPLMSFLMTKFSYVYLCYGLLTMSGFAVVSFVFMVLFIQRNNNDVQRNLEMKS